MSLFLTEKQIVLAKLRTHVFMENKSIIATLFTLGFKRHPVRLDHKRTAETHQCSHLSIYMHLHGVLQTTLVFRFRHCCVTSANIQHTTYNRTISMPEDWLCLNCRQTSGRGVVASGRISIYRRYAAKCAPDYLDHLTSGLITQDGSQSIWSMLM